MSRTEAMEWNAIILLGAYHGINPGMGWLFAVALGMQQGSVRGVFRALPPLALGHAIAVGSVLLVALLAQMVVPLEALKLLIACVLIALGLYRLWRHRHPRFGGMQVGFRDLTVWSFLMASAHGAGLMVLPFVMGMPPNVDSSAASTAGHEHHMTVLAVDTAASSHAALMAGVTPGATAAMLVGVHTLAYFLVMVFVAWVVYSKLGLALLRTAWFNLDWLWAGALVVTGGIVLLM
jgi:hypothetical protein